MTDQPGSAARPPQRDARLAQRFVSLADTLVDDFDLVELLDRLVLSCVELLDVSAAGLLILDRRRVLHPVASSTETTLMLELFQLQNDEGPCLDCVRLGKAVSIDDLSKAHGRWPLFASAAADSGFTSVHALPMRLRRESLGSLNLFHTGSKALAPEELGVAQALADVATIGILQQRSIRQASDLAEQLQTALNTRISIEQAKGVLAEYGGVDMETSFAVLRRHARSHNAKIGDVALALVQGALDPGSVIDRRTG